MPVARRRRDRRARRRRQDAPFLGWSAGTVRFDGAEAEIAQTISYQNTYTRTLSCTFRPRPWNEILRPDGVWEAPVNRDSGDYLYRAADLSPLFA